VPLGYREGLSYSWVGIEAASTSVVWWCRGDDHRIAEEGVSDVSRVFGSRAKLSRMRGPRGRVDVGVGREAVARTDDRSKVDRVCGTNRVINL
jgi:hypothetical protein